MKKRTWTGRTRFQSVAGKKRTRIARPGLQAAAAELSVSPSHLRQVVIGNRKSPELLARYQQREREIAALSVGVAPGKIPLRLQPKPQALAHLEATLVSFQNFDPRFQALLEKVRINIVCVQFDSGPDSPVWASNDMGEPFGAELEQADAGVFDAAKTLPGGGLFAFYHSSKLAKTLTVLKACIEARGLQNHARIFHIETPAGWRVYYPVAEAAELVVPSNE